MSVEFAHVMNKLETLKGYINSFEPQLSPQEEFDMREMSEYASWAFLAALGVLGTSALAGFLLRRRLRACCNRNKDDLDHIIILPL